MKARKILWFRYFIGVIFGKCFFFFHYFFFAVLHSLLKLLTVWSQLAFRTLSILFIFPSNFFQFCSLQWSMHVYQVFSKFPKNLFHYFFFALLHYHLKVLKVFIFPLKLSQFFMVSTWIPGIFQVSTEYLPWFPFRPSAFFFEIFKGSKIIISALRILFSFYLSFEAFSVLDSTMVSAVRFLSTYTNSDIGFSRKICKRDNGEFQYPWL